MAKTKQALQAFILICLALSSIFYYEKMVDGTPDFSPLLNWCPLIAVILVNLIYHRGENPLMIKRAKLKYILLALILPLIYWGLSYGIYLLIFVKEISHEGVRTQTINEFPLYILLLVFCFFTAIGEEVGWRGYMMPKLSELYGFNKAVMLTGLACFLWYLPIFFADSMTTIPLWYQILLFFLMIMACAVLQGYISLKSQSYWPAVVFHATHKFSAELLMSKSIGGDQRLYLLGESGIISVTVMLVMAYFFFKRYARYQAMTLNQPL
mgnify:CR=1 FL=1